MYLTQALALHWVPTHAHGFLGGHGCDIIGNIMGNVIIFEYMGAI